MEEMLEVILTDLCISSPIGLFDQERISKNDFKVSMRISYPASLFKDEEIDSGISYADLYSIIEDEMKKDSLLIETVARRIIERIRSRYSFISQGYVEIVKETPPIKGICGNCGAKYFFKK